MTNRLRAGAKANALALAASGGVLLAFVVATATSWVMERERLGIEMARYGNATAEHVAQLAGVALQRDDRIGLGLAVAPLIERAEIRGIAVQTAANQPFVAVGATVPPQQSYRSRVTHEGAVVGNVHVALNAASFRAPASRHLIVVVVALATALIALGIGSYVAERMDRPRPASRPHIDSTAVPEQDVPAEAEAGAGYAVFANLFERASMAEDERAEALQGAIAVAQAVADLYQAEAHAVGRIGVALTFDGGDEERGITAACAALLLRQLLNDAAGAGLFRYGLELMPASPEDASIADEEHRLALLSSLAPSGELAIGQAAYDVLAPTAQLRVAALDNPAAQALAASAAPSGIVLGASDGLQADAISRQAEEISEALFPR